MANFKIRRAESVRGVVGLPGDKSISHRAAMLASIAEGETRIENYAASADCKSTLDCMAALGVDIVTDGDTVTVGGRGKLGLLRPARPLDCGNSGTTMRLLAGILAGQQFETTLIGDESLQKRPMKRIIEPLSQMGASFGSMDGCAPLTIVGQRPLSAIVYETPVASAQIKSSVLLAGLYSDATATVIERVPTRDHTERMLRWFGVKVDIDLNEVGSHIAVDGHAILTARDLKIPSDVSAAAFFMVAAACLRGSNVTMPNVGLNPSRIGILEVLRELGARIDVSETFEFCNEPVADLDVTGGLAIGTHTEPPVIRGETIANIIDEIPVLAVFGTQLEHGLGIRDASELRLKESDRIAAVVGNLRRMGAHITEFDDGFRVERSHLHGAVIETFQDHRIAMAFAVAGLLADGETEIVDGECAAVSFPGFFETLASVVS